MNWHGNINGNNSNNRYRYEYTYIRDEKLEEKDCIFIKEDVFSLEDGEYIHINKIVPERRVNVFWVEKSTGYVLGGSMIESTENLNNTITPQTIIRNINIGNVVDSDFDFPAGYNIIENE